MKELDNNERLIALIGYRGIGKTTLLLQYASKFSLNNCLYFSADDFLVLENGIIKIVEEFYKLGGRIVIIDEIHKFPNWDLHIKNIYDRFPDLKIRISGSSMLNIVLSGFDLSRRILIKKMNELSFREYFELKTGKFFSSYSFIDIIKNHLEISKDLLHKYPEIYGEFKNYLSYGVYPYFMETHNKENYSQKLYNTINKVIYEDIPSVKKINYANLSFFKKLIF